MTPRTIASRPQGACETRCTSLYCPGSAPSRRKRRSVIGEVESRLSTLSGALLALPSAPLENERDVHLVLFVVQAHRVHDDVDADAEGHFALAFTAGEAVEIPLPEVVARP